MTDFHNGIPCHGVRGRRVKETGMFFDEHIDAHGRVIALTYDGATYNINARSWAEANGIETEWPEDDV